MANFAEPTTLTGYANVIQYIKDRDDSIAKMFYGSTDTNIPTGAVRLNQSSGKHEVYDGSQWNVFALSGIAVSAVETNSILDDAITAAKVKFANATYLRLVTSAAAVIGSFGLSAIDELLINAPASKAIRVSDGGTNRWEISSAGIIPSVTDARTIGSSSFRLDLGYFRGLSKVESIDSSGSSMLIGPLSSHELLFRTNNITRWRIDANGALYSAASMNLGLPANAVANGYFNSIIGGNGAALAIYAPASQTLNIGSGGAVHWAFDSSTSSFRPITNAAVSIGSPSYNCINIWSNNFKNTSGDLNVQAASILYLGSGGAARWGVSAAGHIYPIGAYTLGLTTNQIGTIYTNNVASNNGSAQYFGTVDNFATIIRGFNTNKLEFLPSTHAGGKYTNFNDERYVHGGAAAGSLGGYWQVKINGTIVKIALYHDGAGLTGGMPNGNP